MNAVDKVLKIASDEVGYLEKSASAYKKYGKECLYKKKEYAGSDNYTKFNYEMHQLYPSVMDFPAAWCDAFVDWCFYKAYGVDEAKKLLGGDFNDYTKSSVSLYKEKGLFHLAKGFTPKPGDQIFFATAGTLSTVNHTGLVEKVNDTKVYTIEGNTSNGSEVIANGGAVCRKSYTLTNSRIYGYGRPKYDEAGWHWVNADGKWYYQDTAGNNAHGWVLIRETSGEYCHWYYFDSKGAMLTGLQTVDDRRYYLQETGPLEGACCITDNSGALDVWYLYPKE